MQLFRIQLTLTVFNVRKMQKILAYNPQQKLHSVIRSFECIFSTFTVIFSPDYSLNSASFSYCKNVKISGTYPSDLLRKRCLWHYLCGKLTLQTTCTVIDRTRPFQKVCVGLMTFQKSYRYPPFKTGNS